MLCVHRNLWLYCSHSANLNLHMSGWLPPVRKRNGFIPIHMAQRVFPAPKANPGRQSYWRSGWKGIKQNKVNTCLWIHSHRISSLWWCFTCWCSPMLSCHEWGFNIRNRQWLTWGPITSKAWRGHFQQTSHRYPPVIKHGWKIITYGGFSHFNLHWDFPASHVWLQKGTMFFLLKML